MKQALDLENVFPTIRDIKEDRLREQVEEIWQDLWQASPWEDVRDVPTSPEISEPNVTHIQAVLRMVLAVAEIMEDCHGMSLDRDTLIAAGLLMDAGKLVEYGPDGQGGYELTEIGRMYPHAFYVAHEAINRGVDPEIVNIVLLHSPRRSEYPSTFEGRLLHHVDMLDVLAYHDKPWKKRLFLQSIFEPIVGRESM